MGKVSGKDIRRKRVMDDFIRAARSILEAEGVDGVSARKVADRAGWSYATIYNYFRDINHLLWHCIPLYVEDIFTRIMVATAAEADGLGQLRRAYGTYVRYFLDKPEIFRLMFLTDLGPPPAELESILAKPVLGGGQEQVLELCANQGIIPREDIPLIGEILFSAVHGAIYMQRTGKFPVGPRELERKIDAYINYILLGRRQKQ